MRLPPLLNREQEGHLGFWRNRGSAPLGLPRGLKEGDVIDLMGLGLARGFVLMPRLTL